MEQQNLSSEFIKENGLRISTLDVLFRVYDTILAIDNAMHVTVLYRDPDGVNKWYLEDNGTLCQPTCFFTHYLPLNLSVIKQKEQEVTNEDI